MGFHFFDWSKSCSIHSVSNHFPKVFLHVLKSHRAFRIRLSTFRFQERLKSKITSIYLASTESSKAIPSWRCRLKSGILYFMVNNIYSVYFDGFTPRPFSLSRFSRVPSAESIISLIVETS